MGVTDDLGFTLEDFGPSARVVSLVPSLTESVASTRPEALVGATQWCTHPAGLDVPRVRGTKNPDVAAIVALRPDLVLANQEENRRRDVERLRAAGVRVWVTSIESVPQALTSLRRMFTTALQWDAPPWLDDADAVWAEPFAGPAVAGAIPVWRDPWMVVGARTFTGDLLARIGVGNVFADDGDGADRYPTVTVEQIRARRPDVVLLPDEPYAFTAEDGPEAFPGSRCLLVEGRLLTWYGPSLADARGQLVSALAAAVS